MANPGFSEDDPQDAAAQPPDSKPGNEENTEDNPYKGTNAFNFSDEDELENLRQLMRDLENEKEPSQPFSSNDLERETQSESLLPDISSTLVENESDNQTDNEAMPGFDYSSDQWRAVPFDTDKNDSPFFEDEIDQSSKDYPASSDSQSSQDSTVENKESPEITWDQIYKEEPLYNDITERINSLRNEDAHTGDKPSTSPFVLEEELSQDNGDGEAVTNKLKKGLVPAETVELLITPQMSEADVVEISRQMGIAWNIVPGNSREEKTRAIISYFKSKEFDQQGWPLFTNAEPQFLMKKTEDDWRESDSRLQALQETLIPEDLPGDGQKTPILNRLKEDFDLSGRLMTGLTVGLSVLALGLLLFIGYVLYKKFSTPVITAPPAAQINPVPANLQISTGWSFTLTTGVVKKGVWNPIGPEWLSGTEVCRLISLPWNKQLDAAYNTFEVGDIISLTMSNGDVWNYKVKSTEIVNTSEVDKLISGTSPCLVIEITKTDSTQRQVIISEPDKSATGVAKPTSTPN